MIPEKFKSWFNRSKITNLIAVGMFILAVLGFLFGPGVLNKPPKPCIHISCGAISLGVPAKQMLEIIFMKFTMMGEDLKRQIDAALPQALKDCGLEEEKIALIIEVAKGSAPKSALQLTPREEKITLAAYGKVMADLTESMKNEFKIPDAVLFFEIDNTGRAGAKDPRIVVRVNGDIYDKKIYSDNRVLNEEKKDDEVLIDLSAIAPASKTTGIIWFSSSANKPSQRNEITVSYETGTVRQSFRVNDFYLKSD